MTNKNTAIAQQDEEVKELVVDARFIMRSYDQKDKDGNVIGKKEYLSFELVEPFGPEELLKDVPLKAKWDKYDEKTKRLVRSDRVFGFMSYYAEKALRTMPEVLVKVHIRPVRYKSKKNNQYVTYPGIFADPTFAELADERQAELVVKDAKDANWFELLAGNALGIRFTSRDNQDDDDIGL